MAARVFTPLVVVDMCLDQLVDAIRDLCIFRFDGFCHSSGMIEDAIDELSSCCAVINLTPNSFWSEVDGAAGYDASLKQKAEKDPNI